MTRVSKLAGKLKLEPGELHAPPRFVFAIAYENSIRDRFDYGFYFHDRLLSGNFAFIPFCYAKVVIDHGDQWEVRDPVEHMYFVNKAVLLYQSFSRPYLGPKRFKKDRYQLQRDVSEPSWFGQRSPKRPKNDPESYPLNPSRDVQRDRFGPLKPKSLTFHMRARSYQSWYLKSFMFDFDLRYENDLGEIWARYVMNLMGKIEIEKARSFWWTQVQSYLTSRLAKNPSGVPAFEHDGIVNQILEELSKDEKLNERILSKDSSNEARDEALHKRLGIILKSHGVQNYHQRNKRDRVRHAKSLDGQNLFGDDTIEADKEFLNMCKYNFKRHLEAFLTGDELRLVKALYEEKEQVVLYDLMVDVEIGKMSYKDIALKYKVSQSQVGKLLGVAKALGSKIRKLIAEVKPSTVGTERARKFEHAVSGIASVPEPKRRAKRSQRAKML